jgi:hypothetical protein
MRRVHFYGDGRGYCISRITSTTGLSIAFDPDTALYVSDPLASAGELGNYIVDFSADNRFSGVSITAAEIDADNLTAGVNLHYDELGGTVTPGGAPGTGGYIVVTSPTESYRISVSAFTGKLTVDPEPL